MQLDKRNAVVADKCYCDGAVCAEDVSVNLPAVNFLTTTVRVMGDMDVVIAGLLEAMEATITRVGVDKGLAAMTTPVKHSYVFNWAQNVVKVDGTTGPEGCKAFVEGGPKGVPAIGVEIGNNTETEIAIAVYAYRLVVGGEEVVNIDRFGGKCIINGVDYYATLRTIL